MGTKLTPLQQTIFNLAMTGGQIQWYGKNISQVNLQNIEEIFDNIKDVKPILHSLNKLTEPILEGGKVPIVELENMFGDLSSLTDTMLVNSWTINGIVKWLKANHFNIENLPEGTHVEKSTLKTE